MKRTQNRSVNTTFNLISAVLLIVLLLALAYNNYRRDQSMVVQSAVQNARLISQQIIITRDYLSEHVTGEPEHNYSLVPQVAATRIAQKMTSGTSFYVRQVSLRYRNPNNRPDPFETHQLELFKNNRAKESWQVTSQNGKKTLRYLVAMSAERSCLACHGAFETAPRFVQTRFPRGHFSYGYTVGEVIGAVSVSVPMEGLYYQIGKNLRRDILYDSIVLIAFLAITAVVIRKTILTPVKEVAGQITTVAKTGNFSGRLERTSGDEIGELVRSFNQLMEELDRKTQQRMESEERYRNFIEIAQSPIVTFMADGKIVISNQKAEKLFGLSKQELLGLSIFEFMEDGEGLRQAIDDYFNLGSSELIGTTTLQRVRDVCGQLFDTEMVISVSQSDQNLMFSAILRTVKSKGNGRRLSVG